MQYRCFHYCNVWTIIWHAKFNLLFLCPYPNICFFLLHCETWVKTSLGRDVQHKKRPQQRCQWKVVEILLAVLSRFSLHVQASPGVGSCFQQMHCPGATWKDLETHMCSEVAPRQFVNSTEKGCHGEKSDFREDMVQGWQEAQFLQLLPEACEPPLTPNSISLGRTKKAACPSTPDGGFVLMHYCSFCSVAGKKN